MTKWINRDLVVSPHYIGLCQSEKAFEKELKRLKVPVKSWPDCWVPEGKDACVHRLITHSGRRQCAVVCVRQDRDTTPAQVVGLLVHESVHVWQEIRDDIGEDKPSSEFEAYSIQRISQSLISAYKMPKKKGKKP